MSSRARVFSGNAALASHFQPYIAPPLLVPRGVFFGYQLRTGRPAYWGPSYLKSKGLIEATTCDVEGPRNHGKSVLVECLTMRQAAQQAGRDPISGKGKLRRKRVQVFNRKHVEGKAEIKPVMDHLLATTISLSDIGAVNMLDLGMGMSVHDITRSCLVYQEDAKRSPLDSIEVLVTIIMVFYMVTRQPDKTHLLALESLMKDFSATYVRFFVEQTKEESRQQFVTDAVDGIASTDMQPVVEQSLDTSNLLQEDVLATLRQGALRCCGYLNELLRSGRFGTLLTGTRGLSDLLTDDIITFDLTGMPPAAADLFEGGWYQWMMTAEAAGKGYLLPDLHISEEEATAMQSMTHALYLSEIFRKARTLQTEWVATTQFGNDYSSVGEPGSRLRSLGQVIDRSFALRVLGRQPTDDDILHAITKRGVSDGDAWGLTQLPVGCWGIHVPGQPLDFVQHVVLPTEWPLVTTSNSANERVSERVNVYELPAVQRRLAELARLTREGQAYVIGSEPA